MLALHRESQIRVICNLLDTVTVTSKMQLYTRQPCLQSRPQHAANRHVRSLVKCDAKTRRRSVAPLADIITEDDGVDQGSAVNKQKNAMLNKTILHLTDKYGKGAVIKGRDKPDTEVKRFSCGCTPLDVALGGGLPRGRIIEVYGPESTGKTTLALHAIAEIQKAGGIAAIVDVEQALDLQHAKRIGVDVAELVISQPSYGEEAMDIVDTMAASGAIDLVVLDSVSALVPKAELEGDIGSSQVGHQARLMSIALRRLAGTANNGNCSIIFINQLRQKVAVMYGNPETTSGGNALKYYSSVRIDLRRKDTIKSGDDVKGIKVRAKVTKNKVAPPFREASFDILFDRGIDAFGALFETAEVLTVITRRGAYYYYGDQRLGQGREAALETLRTDDDLKAKVEADMRAAMESQGGFSAAPDDDDDLDLDGALSGPDPLDVA